ncbi:MAG: ABC transporter substrate-binding protein [Marinobacter sp.]|nr:ABC transporter substrate-binding protein [Marinobacter sp.]
MKQGLIRAGFVVCLLILLPVAAQAAITVTDIAGRTVTVPERVERIVLGESRYIPTLAILEGEQVLDRLVGMLPEFEMTDPGGYAQYRARFPAIEQIPRIGHASADSFSLERVVALRADLAIFSIEGHGPGARNKALIERLERAGVAVIFIDFRQDPLANTPRSLALLGKVLGREAEAERFLAFYLARMARVQDAVAAIPEADYPAVFLHSRAGLHDACCETMVQGMMGHFITAAGAHNVAASRVPGVSGVMNLEYLITEQPDRYLATAIGSAQRGASEQGRPYVMLGAGVSAADARQSLYRATRQPGLPALTAVQENRAFAIWHHFYNTPLHVAAIEAMARWFHPEHLAHLNPEDTLATFYREFQPVPLNGTFWIGLDSERDSLHE